MAIFERLKDLFKANVNDLIDKAEDPEKMVKQVIIDMEEQLRDATQALGQAMASERQAQKQLENCRKISQDWEAKAKMALQAGNQELAKKALESKVNNDKQLAAFEQSCQGISAQVLQLREKVEVMRSKLEEARSRQTMLIARAKMADAQKEIATSLSGADSNSAFSKLDKMEEKIQGKEAQAEAFTQMSGDSDPLKDEFKDLETNSAVDAELQRLMQEMGQENK